MFIVVDIGGTKTRVARSSDLESIDEPLIIETSHSYEQGVSTIAETVKRLCGNERVEGISVGITGTISSDHKIPLTTPHLPAWRGRPFARELEVALSTNVWLINDTAQVEIGRAHV